MRRKDSEGFPFDDIANRQREDYPYKGPRYKEDKSKSNAKQSTSLTYGNSSEIFSYPEEASLNQRLTFPVDFYDPPLEQSWSNDSFQQPSYPVQDANFPNDYPPHAFSSGQNFNPSSRDSRFYKQSNPPTHPPRNNGRRPTPSGLLPPPQRSGVSRPNRARKNNFNLYFIWRDPQLKNLLLVAIGLFVVILFLLVFVVRGFAAGESPQNVSSPNKNNITGLPTSSVDATAQIESNNITPAGSVNTLNPAETTGTTENVALTTLVPPPSSQSPVVALTFDDGPDAILTPQLLDILKTKDIKATFFLLGNRVDAVDPALVKRILAEGHEVGNHSYHHPDLKNLPIEEAIKEITDTNAAIFKASGSYPTVFRPPMGSFNDEILAAVKANGNMPLIHWSWESCPSDWEEANKNSTFISNHIINNVQNGHIVLLHDIHKTTVEAMATTIDGLVAKGYRFTTVSNLINNANPDKLQTGKAYYYGDR